MVWKLLKQHISKAQLSGFFLANLCGTVIILLSVQFYQDIRPLFTQADSFMSNDYLIISKKISTLGSLVGRGTNFTKAELADLEEQPFVKQVGAFKPAQFKVSAGMAFQGANVSTAMFFEAVSNNFLDTKPEGWGFVEGQEEIPIILPRNYLNLYNFGFAKSRSLPQLSEGMLGMVTLDIRISGNGSRINMRGRIVGFSNRLNTILVPESFLDWANNHYGNKQEMPLSRLIVEVNNPADKRIVKYMDENGFEVEGNQLDTGKTTWFLKLIIGLVLLVGIIISVLSLYILMLSIYLLLQKNTIKMESLLLIGYSPAQVARPYQLLTIALNLLITGLSILFVHIVRNSYVDTIATLLPGMKQGSVIMLWIAGLALFTVASVLNFIIIRRKINQIWERH